MNERKIFAPDWVIILGGGIFIFGGLAMAFQHRPVFVSLLGNLIVLPDTDSRNPASAETEPSGELRQIPSRLCSHGIWDV